LTSQTEVDTKTIQYQWNAV